MILSSPQSVKDILTSDPSKLHSGEANAFLASLLGPESVFVQDEAPHLRQRRLLLTPLKGERMQALFDAILAGYDTTSVALAWVLEQVLARAQVVERLRDELRSTTGGIPPRADQVSRLCYLDAVIHESLRVRTVVPFMTRLEQLRSISRVMSTRAIPEVILKLLSESDKYSAQGNAADLGLQAKNNMTR